MKTIRDRKEIILNSIIRQYIQRAVPVSSSSVLDDCRLDVSSATVRSEIAHLEKEGYITHPHYAAGSVPSDKGYRFHVAGLKSLELEVEEQFLISHLFHQVEDRLEEWLNLAASVLAQRVKNVVVVTSPRSSAAVFKHLELVSIQSSLVLVVLVLHGARVRQQLLNFETSVSQEDLNRLAGEINGMIAGLTQKQIKTKIAGCSTSARRVLERILFMMKSEDERSGQDIFMEGWHFLLHQPEFTQSRKLAAFIEMAEQKHMIENVVPELPDEYGLKVIIGNENKDANVQDCSVIISHYGLPEEPLGSIAVVGPTRMDYYRNITVLNYVCSIISLMVAELYGISTDTPKTNKSYWVVESDAQ